MKLDIKIHESHPDFISFVYATWLHSYKHGSYACKRITSTVYFTSHHAVIDELLKRPNVKILVACPSEQPKDGSKLVFGYIVYETKEDMNIVHYLYVKKNFRKFGIAKMLFEQTGLNTEEKLYFNHWCYDTDWMVIKYPKLTYNPYLANY